MASSEAASEVTIVSARKPYTITKQRERWSEEEHNRFLEALKLYGRAWQRIEEHIGTKTAVQIRSHAQKFFSKLEKEALTKGVPVAQAIDIEIPPPRPKRKPSNPYPRKCGYVSSPNTQTRVKDGKEVPFGCSHTHSTKQVLDLEKEPLPEKCAAGDGVECSKETCRNEKHSEASPLFPEASTLANENSNTTTEAVTKSCNVTDCSPVKKQPVNMERRDSDAAYESNQYQKPQIPITMGTAHTDLENGNKSFPKHAPVQILDGSLGASSLAHSSDVSCLEPTFHQMSLHPGHPALFNNVESQNSTLRSNNHQVFPGFHPSYIPYPNIQENNSSFQQMSSNFSSLIISTLLQNPAAHAAATFAASFWPGSNMETTANIPPVTNGFHPLPGVPAPSVAAIAGATVAAATAWWAAHGLLPVCSPPLHGGFTWPPPTAAAPSTTPSQTQSANEEREANNFQNPASPVPKPDQPDQELSDALQPQHSASKSSTSSADSGNTNGANIDETVAAAGSDHHEEKIQEVTTEKKESSKGEVKNQVDRSSCGSNTPSGSDAETDALLEKNDNNKGEEGMKEPDADQNPSTSEPGNRRNRIIYSFNDSWKKEVSEEGRLAFQALFSRDRLPQSFSPPQYFTREHVVISDRQNGGDTNEVAPQIDLNNSTRESCSNDQDRLRGDSAKDGLLTNGLTPGKLETRRTGFKPYKRCSMEAMERNRMVNDANHDQEKCPKRLRLEGEAST